MSGSLRYGILGTGNIARQFADGVAGARRSVVTAIGSRSQDTADAFAKACGIARAHPTYDALLADDTVDAVYISTPNALHHEWTLKALAAGKHVLCEKPIGVTAAEAEEMFDTAQKHGRRLMEAFMYRCHPLTAAWLGAIEAGEIGDVTLIRTSFCYRAHHIDGNVRYSVPLAGGALMDIGCYCVNLSRRVAGAEPASVHVTGRLHESGVDVFTAGTLVFPGGITASFTCGMDTQADNTTHIAGRDGWIEVPRAWKPLGDQSTYIVDGQNPPKQDGGGAKRGREERSVTTDVPLYGIEADAFAGVALDGDTPPVTRDGSIGNMRVLDTMRAQLGLPF